jgi:(p)ppGpp synthase/HD superfamily hydrolase
VAGFSGRSDVKKLLKAIRFAEEAHRGQTRKYTGAPYIEHPLAVAEMVAGRGLGLDDFVATEEDQAMVAVLHDVVEDCGVTLSTLEAVFGRTVANGVDALTSRKEEGNRATRKAKDRERIAAAPNWVKTIKVADMLHNMKTIVEFDKNFAHVFMRETRDMLPCLEGGDKVLLDLLKFHVNEYFERRL